MIQFFKKVYKKITTPRFNDNKELEELLQSINFYKQIIPPDFYSRLFEIRIYNSINKEDPKQMKAYTVLKGVVDELAPLYDQILVSGFKKGALDSFLLKFKEITSKDFEFPIMNGWLGSYWYQPIRKTREDIKASGNQELIDNFEEFHSEVRKIAEAAIGINIPQT